jgi:hypothetical protein
LPYRAQNRKAFDTREEAIGNVLREFHAMTSSPKSMKKAIEEMLGEESLGGLFDRPGDKK